VKSFRDRHAALQRAKSRGPLLSDGLAARLRALREEQGLARFALCRAAGVSAYVVATIEAWGQIPLIDTVEKLARALKVSPGFLAFGAELPFVPDGGPRYRGLGERLRSARLERGLSHADLAARSGVTYETLLYLEDGRYLPSFPVTEALAGALGVPPAWLVYGEGPAPFPPPAPPLGALWASSVGQVVNAACDVEGLPRRLRAAREAAGLSRLALSQRAASGSVEAIERGRFLPRADAAERLARAMGLSPSFLAFGVPQPGPGDPRPQVTGVGARLRQAREQWNVTTSALAEACDMRWKTLGLIEQGRRIPRLDTAVALARALDVPVSWLVYGEGPAPFAPGTQPPATAAGALPGADLPRAVQAAQRRRAHHYPGAKARSRRLKEKGPDRRARGLAQADGGIAGLPVRLREARAATGLAGTPFARWAGVGSETCLKIERGEQVPTTATIEKLARALRLSPSFLAFGDPLPFLDTETPRWAELGARLKLALRRRGKDRHDLMRALKVLPRAIIHLEEGGAPKLTRLVALARVLEVPPCWLAYGEGPDPLGSGSR
jgi:transcriptional regulator with XRE-family HTH domain